jgi:phosphate starvation-inducible protein PhoH
LDNFLDDFFDTAPSKKKYNKTVKRGRGAKVDKEPNQHYSEQRSPLNLIDVQPKTVNQKKAFDAFKKDYHLLMYGTAGTGKSFCSLYLALKAVLTPGSELKKVVIIRSMTPSKDSGFLPGSLAEKAKIYELPYVGICAELFNRENAYETLKKMGVIEFTTTSYLRGLTMRDSIVILDEFQNAQMMEIHTVITRVGENSRVIVSGDTKQNDLTKKYEVSGGPAAIRILENMPSFKSVEFDVDDVIRSGVVREWILSRDELDL